MLFRSGNVVANGGLVSITLATGNLSGNGSIAAGPTGNVYLTASQGRITLASAPGQVSGNVLTIAAQNATTVNTSVQSLVANIRGLGQTLTVNEANDLAVGQNVISNNGAIAICLATPAPDP